MRSSTCLTKDYGLPTTSGSVRGALGNQRPYRVRDDDGRAKLQCPATRK